MADSPMRQAASKALKSKPKTLGGLIDFWKSLTKPFGYKPPAKQGTIALGPKRNAMKKIEESDTYNRPPKSGNLKPYRKPGQNYTEWP